MHSLLFQARDVVPFDIDFDCATAVPKWRMIGLMGAMLAVMALRRRR